MKHQELRNWVLRSQNRTKVLLNLDQPLTVRQISRRLELPLNTCSVVLRELDRCGLSRCLNGPARQNRIYWLTDSGVSCQRQMCQDQGLPKPHYSLEAVAWQLYGWLCFSHRSAVIKAVDEPLQPAAIKRKARSQNPGLRMSANNVRDVIRLFLKRRIVRRVHVHKHRHPRYELAEGCQDYRRLLLQADWRGAG